MDTVLSEHEFVLDDDIAVSKVPSRYLDLVDADLEGEHRQPMRRGTITSKWGE